jgi:predicted acetyltransferase
MPEVEIRPLHAEEMDSLNFVMRTVFAGEDDPEKPQPLQPEWTLGAFEDGELATTFGASPLRWRLNGAQVDVAAVTAVGTLPNKRRRGYLRRIMTQSFRDQRDAGQHIAILWASHAAIYQRFGYAITASQHNYDVSPRDIRFTSGPRPSGSIRLTTDQETDTLRNVYRTYINERNGELSRVPVMWELLFRAWKEEKPVYQAIYEEGGMPQGYAIYRQKDAYQEHPEESMRLRVAEVIWNTPEAYVALWEYLAGHDLTRRIVYGNAPEDDPLFHLIDEPRMLRHQVTDGILTRIVDVAKALPKRPYGAAAGLTFEVVDADCDWNQGVWELETSGAESEVRSSTARPQLTIPVHSLASMTTGFLSPSQLARQGQIEVADHADLAEWDRVFAVSHRPHCFQEF